MAIPDEWYGDPTPRTQEEMERVRGGKEGLNKFREDFIASLKEDKDEDETVETEDKFLPRRR